jgi:acyl-CoA reductase-like NAD-dependent aldehyde dehydrogenase
MSALEQSDTTVRSNGAPPEQAGRIAVHNPATGELIGHVDDMSPAQVEAVVERARLAQPGWEALGFDARGDVMYELRHWLVQNRDRVLDVLVRENGKTREDALLAEMFYVCDALGFWAKNARKYLADERVKTHSPLLIGKKVVVRYRPHGVVGVIGPWNYPLTNSFGDCIPALMAGNSVVLKPSEVTPLTNLMMGEAALECGAPADVFSVVTGAGRAGAALVDNVDMIHFTGSTATGRKVAVQAAERLIPVSLELGGKDPMIVLRDADLDRAANTAVQWAFSNSGQICISVERVYVEEPVHDAFVQKVVEKTRALRQGAPGQPAAVDVGAMTWPPQVDLVESHVNDAVEKGAQVRVGGKRREGKGDFFEPTVLTDVDHSMLCMTEETFGPTLPIMKVRDEEEAVEKANDSRFGLNSSVFTKDVEKGERIARRIEAGSTCVNDCITNYSAQELPFGGVKESGIGVRHSAAGIQKYCHPHAILITRFAGKREPYYFPYSKRATKLLERLMVLMYGRGSKKR